MNAKDIFSSKEPVGLVYRSNTPNGLQFVRSLGEAGVPVLALSDGSRAARMYSRYSYPMRCPDGLRNSDAFIRFLEELGQRLTHRAVLYLMNDPHMIVVAQHRDLLDQYYRIPLPQWEILDRCLDKVAMYETAVKAGIPLPVTAAPSGIEELQRMAPRIPYPCILKPVSRYEFRDGALRQKAFQHTYDVKALRANNEDELLSQYRQVLAEGFQVIVQEEIPGPDHALYTVGIYADKQSEIQATFTGRKLHQLPPDFGLCTYGESLTEPGLVEMGTKLTKALGFHGIAQIEFKKDARDGQLKLMEINPRGWQWSYLATACGVNLPDVAYRDLCGLPLPATRQIATRRTWTNMVDEVRRYRQYERQGKLVEKKPLGAWLRWVISTVSRRENDDAVFCWRDPIPGVMVVMRSTLVGVRHGLRAIFSSKARDSV